MSTQVRLTLLEEKPLKHHTDFLLGCNPTFNQTFAFPRHREQLAGTVIRLRVYRRRKRRSTPSASSLIAGRQAIVGEAFFQACHVDTSQNTPIPSQHTLQLKEVRLLWGLLGIAVGCWVGLGAGICG